MFILPTTILGLALLGAGPAAPVASPLVLHRNMEIDDLDREIQHLHDTAALKRGQLASTQRLAQRGALSRAELEHEIADVRFQEAREAETIAYRALKVYERDFLSKAIPPDDARAFTLILDWLKKREAIAQVDVDFRGYSLKQSRILSQRKAASRQELIDAELEYNSALASLALNQSRQAELLRDQAASRDGKPDDSAETRRLNTEFLKARVHYLEIVAEGARARLDAAHDRSRRGTIPASEVTLFQKANDEAAAALNVGRDELQKSEAEHTPPASKPD